MRTCLEIAERHAEAAIANFGKDGELTPAILLMGQDQELVCSVLPILKPETNGMPGALGKVGMMFGMLFDARWIALISETWMYSTKGDEEPPQVRRGELGERAEAGDTTVHTGLLISVYDLDDIDRSHTLTYDTDANYERHDSEGVHEGEIGDTVRWLAEAMPLAKKNRPPGKPPFELVRALAQALIEKMDDVVAAALVYGEGGDDE